MAYKQKTGDMMQERFSGLSALLPDICAAVFGEYESVKEMYQKEFRYHYGAYP